MSATFPAPVLNTFEFKTPLRVRVEWETERIIEHTMGATVVIACLRGKLHRGARVKLVSPSGGERNAFVLKVFLNDRNNGDPMIATGSERDASDFNGLFILRDIDDDLCILSGVLKSCYQFGESDCGDAQLADTKRARRRPSLPLLKLMSVVEDVVRVESVTSSPSVLQAPGSLQSHIGHISGLPLFVKAPAPVSSAGTAVAAFEFAVYEAVGADGVFVCQ